MSEVEYLDDSHCRYRLVRVTNLKLMGCGQYISERSSFGPSIKLSVLSFTYS